MLRIRVGVLLMTAILLVLFTLALAYANGANDVSKGVATLVGGGLASPRRGLVWGTVWTMAGGIVALALARGLVTTFSTGLLTGAPIRCPSVLPGDRHWGIWLGHRGVTHRPASINYPRADRRHCRRSAGHRRPRGSAMAAAGRLGRSATRRKPARLRRDCAPGAEVLLDPAGAGLTLLRVRGASPDGTGDGIARRRRESGAGECDVDRTHRQSCGGVWGTADCLGPAADRCGSLGRKRGPELRAGDE